MTRLQAEKNGKAFMSLQSKKYAIKVPLMEYGDWLFVTKDGPEGLYVVLYDTREEAEAQAKLWGGNGVVVEYEGFNPKVE